MAVTLQQIANASSISNTPSPPSPTTITLLNHPPNSTNLPPHIPTGLPSQREHLGEHPQGSTSGILGPAQFALPILGPKVPTKGKLPKPFKGKEGALEKFLFQMEEYFDPYVDITDRNKISILTSVLDDTTLDWWRKRWQTLTSWDQAKQALILQYGNKFIKDNSRKQIEELTQTGRVQDYLAEVERLNRYAGLSQKDVLSFIYRKIKPKL